MLGFSDKSKAFFEISEVVPVKAVIAGLSFPI